MLIGNNLSLFRILKITWKIDLLMIVFCSITFLIDKYVFVSLKLPIAFLALMGTAIAFFIGFNNNQAYNRWWEARIIFVLSKRKFCANFLKLICSFSTIRVINAN